MTKDDLLAKFDKMDNHEIGLVELTAIARTTIANIISEASRPLPTESNREIITKLADATLLGHLLDTLEDMRYDFNLNDRDATSATLNDLFHTSMRNGRIHFDDRRRHEYVLKNVFTRFSEKVNDIRSLERGLRDRVREYDGNAEWLDRGQRFEELFEAAFDAALTLEANFEDRLFTEKVA